MPTPVVPRLHRSISFGRFCCIAARILRLVLSACNLPQPSQSFGCTELLCAHVQHHLYKRVAAIPRIGEIREVLDRPVTVPVDGTKELLFNLHGIHTVQLCRI